MFIYLAQPTFTKKALQFGKMSATLLASTLQVCLAQWANQVTYKINNGQNHDGIIFMIK